MFKRSAALPARPPIPSREEIMEDLASAKHDDVVFKVEQDPSEGSQYMVSGNFQGYESDPENVYFSPSEAYLKVDFFLQRINQLQKHITSIESQKESLLKLEESLMQDMDSIKKEMGKSADSSSQN